MDGQPLKRAPPRPMDCGNSDEPRAYKDNEMWFSSSFGLNVVYRMRHTLRAGVLIEGCECRTGGPLSLATGRLCGSIRAVAVEERQCLISGRSKQLGA